VRWRLPAQRRIACGWIKKRSNASAGPTLLNHSGQSAQNFIDLFRIPKNRCDIGLKHHDEAASGVARRVPVGLRAAEVLFREYLVGVGQSGLLTGASRFLHILSVHGVSSAAR
jgi:hypothetical protein